MAADYDLLVLNGLVVTDTETGEYDIAVKDEKIEAVLPRGSFANSTATRRIDAQGGYVMPGGVDAHVHLDEPPLFGKGSTADNYETGSRSAIAGGTTTIVTFAPQRKEENSLLPTLRATHAKAADVCYADYGFHLLVSNPSEQALSEFQSLREEGVSSLKIYMTYAALQLRDGQLLDVLLEARGQGITTMVHAENGEVVEWMTAQLERRRLLAPKYHAAAHPKVAEVEATYRAIKLSEFIDAPILLVHVSSPLAVSHIRGAQQRGLPVYGETCPQYLFLTKKDLDKPGFEGAKCVCSPPPRDDEADQDEIWRGLDDGTLTVFSSDHCPFFYDNPESGKKAVITAEYPHGHFKFIPNGIAGLETRLPLLLSADRLPLQDFVKLTSANPAKLYGLHPQKGALVPKVSDADLAIWYPPNTVGEIEIRNEDLHHNVDYTPYEGRKVTQWPRYTVLRGEVVWDRNNGGVVGRKGYGKFVKRGVSSLPGPRHKEDWATMMFPEYQA